MKVWTNVWFAGAVLDLPVDPREGHVLPFEGAVQHEHRGRVCGMGGYMGGALVLQFVSAEYAAGWADELLEAQDGFVNCRSLNQAQ